jgi:hypothetical protein
MMVCRNQLTHLSTTFAGLDAVHVVVVAFLLFLNLLDLLRRWLLIFHFEINFQDVPEEISEKILE